MSLDRDETKLGHVRGRQASKERKGGRQEANASGEEGREADEKDWGVSLLVLELPLKMTLSVMRIL
jgi:hypothetical protein